LASRVSYHAIKKRFKSYRTIKGTTST
jgi:hypothetical protein